MFKLFQFLAHLFLSWNRPGFYLYVRLTHRLRGRDVLIPPGADTDLVVESAGAAASTSFIVYLRTHNPALRMAFNSHCSGAVLYAIRHDIPVLVITRNPIDSYRSLLRRFPHFGRLGILARYAAFHLPLLNKEIPIVDYQVAIHDPQAVVRAVNERYGLALAEGDGVLPWKQNYSKADYLPDSVEAGSAAPPPASPAS